MPAPRGILVLSSAADLQSAVSKAIAGDTRLAIESACADLKDLVAQLGRTGAPAAVIDVDPDPQRVLAALEEVIARFGETRFVLVSSATLPDLLLEAMRIGARHVMARSSIATDLVPALHRLIPSGTAKPHALGGMVAMIPACGGTGATTLAINLADELRRLAERDTLLVDLDCAYGPMARFLNLDGQYGVSDVLASGAAIDGEIIRSAAMVHDKTLHVLASPAAGSILPGDAIAFEHLPHLLGSSRSAFEYTVVDAARVPIGVASRVATGASLTLIPFLLNVISVRSARAIFRALVDAGGQPSLTVPVAMRSSKRGGMISIPEAKKAIGCDVVGTIADDPGAAAESINLGKPLAQAAPRSSLRKEIQQLATKLHNARAAGTPMSTPW